MTHHARILDVRVPADIEAELDRIGAEPSERRRIAGPGISMVIRVNAVPLDSAAVITRKLRAVGGDAASGPGLSGRADACDMLLFATASQLRRVNDAVADHSSVREVTEEAVDVATRADKARLPIRWPGGELRLDHGTLVMGIVNVTPDSFSGDGIGKNADLAAQQAASFAAAGAHIIDVGGESTRPGSDPVSPEEEMSRVLPAIEAIRQKVPLPISIDTSKASVAAAALEAGAQVVNDVTALRGDPDMARVVAESGAPVVLMHMLGRPKDMQVKPYYRDVITEIYDFLAERIEAAVSAGIQWDRIIVDPGIGFGKRLEDNLEILRRLREFLSLGRPLLIGTSRKSVIAGVLNLPPDQRVEGTAATVACAILNGASIVRVHDVEPMVRVARMTDAIVRGAP